MNAHTVYFHVLALRRALSERGDLTKYIVTESGRGYRFAARVTCLDSGVPPVPPVSSRVAVPRIAPLYGRRDVVERIVGRCGSSQFQTIVGPGGIGKTSVALMVAAAIEALGRKVYIVDFAPIASADRAESAVAIALGVPAMRGDPLPDLIAVLNEGPSLVVFDNCEHVVHAAAVLAERLLREAPLCSLIATSREPLSAEGEELLHLPPLPAPRGLERTLSCVTAFASVQLFVERARAVWEDFDLNEDNVQAVCEICASLDGVPLAIEFAAARLDIMDPVALEGRLGERLTVLTTGRRTAPHRHRTLRAMMDWSYDLLDEETRTFLKALSVFRSSFDMPAAAAVVDDHADSEKVLRCLTQLCSKSLLVLERSSSMTRFRLLNTTRYYAAEKLADAGMADTVARRHALYVLTKLASLAVGLPASARDDTTTIDENIIDDIRAALDWAFSATGDAATGIKLVLATGSLWFDLALMVEYSYQLERAITALSQAQLSGTSDEVELLLAFDQAASHAGWPTSASGDSFRRAPPIAGRLGMPEPALRRLGGVQANSALVGDSARGAVLAEQVATESASERRASAVASQDCSAVDLVDLAPRGGE